MKRKYLIILIAVIHSTIAWDCSNSLVNEDKFSLRFYRKKTDPNSSKPLISLSIDDIDYVDWPNMSFKLKDSVVENKIVNTEFKGGISKEYCMISFNDDSLYININNNGVSSNDHFDYEKPFMYTFKPTKYISIGSSIFSKDNWIVIHPFYWNDSLRSIDLYKNEKLFNYLKDKGKLIAKSWQKNDANKTVNAPNTDFIKDFENRFQSELP